MSDKEQVIQALRATLISVKGSLTLNQCNRDYRELQGEFIPYKKLGYPSLEKLFQGVPGFSIAQVNGEWLVDAIASKETQHIASMVARQKSNKKRPGKFNYEVMARGAGRGRGLPGRGIWRRPYIRPRVSTLRPPFDLIPADPAFPRCKPAPDDSALTQVMNRGTGRGRGLPGRDGIWRRPFIKPRVSTLRSPFDLILADPAFPRCKPAPDDSALTQALLKRHAELCPTPVEQWAVLNLVNKLQTVLDHLVVAPGNFAACQLEEVRQVGSYKKGTMMTGKNVADIVVIMKTLPTKEAVEGLSNKVNEELNKLMRAEGLGNVSSACHERGFTVSASAAAVRVLVTTLHQNLRRLEPEVHLEYKVINSHLAAIRQGRWFEENAHHSSIKVLIRLLRDMCARHSGLEPLTPWMIDLLAHHCIMNNPARQALPINVAFRRALSLLASGLFLPGCSGLPDPCEAAHASVHTALDLRAQDHAAATAQTGRGLPGRDGIWRRPFIKPRVSTLRSPFDLILADPAFPRCKPAPDDSALTQALLKRHAELCPTPVEQWAVLNLVNKLQTVLDHLVVAPGNFAACQLEEVRQVGSYKKGTMMTGKNVADIVVIMKTLPTKEAVEGLSNKVNEELNKLMRAEGLGNVSSACHERGFTVSASAAAVRVLVTTLHQNLRRLEPEVHLEYKVINSHLAAIRQGRWFEENAHHSSIKVLIRLLRDMCARHSGLEPLTPWMIDLLAHHCIMNNPARQALPINVAFRRALSLLASGLFLPGCSGLPDPCEAAHASVHTALDLRAQDHAAATAQTLLRVVARGGHRYVLGLQPFEGDKDISTEITVWDGVVVSPLAPAYQETPEPMDVDDKDDGA